MIGFSKHDKAELLHVKGNDPLVVSVTITGFQVKRILIDTDSVVEVLSWQAFKHMGLKDSTLKQSSSIYGFRNQLVEVIVSMVLTMVLGDDEHIVTEIVGFFVVDHPTTNYTIFGLPLMKMAKMVVAKFYLKVKFPTSMGEGFINFDQQLVRKCHVLSL